MTIDWSGIFHILATPFTDDAALDVDGVPQLIESVLATGVSGLTILGIAGEAHRLNDEERRRMVEAVVKEVRGRYVPVVVGVSASGTHLAAGFAAMAREHGADAVMVAPPAGARNLDAVAEYYQAVMQAAQCPLVLQDEPVTTQRDDAGAVPGAADRRAARGPGGEAGGGADAAQDHPAARSSPRDGWRSSAGWAASTSSRSSRAAPTAR